jgi:multiple sugar transport system permease protein
VTTRETLAQPTLDRQTLWGKVLMGVGLLLLFINGFFPLLWMIVTSFKPESELLRKPLTYLPASPTFENYLEVFESLPFHRFLFNSAVVSITATLLCVLFAALAGYALGRLNLPGRKFILTLIVMTSMFPAIVLLVPLYRLFLGGLEVPVISPIMNFLHDVGLSFLPETVITPNLLNTYPALIIPYIALSLPIATLILTSFFQLIPKDLESAALVDGTSKVGALFRIIAPLSAPGIVTAAIIVFVNSWNEFLLALTFNTTLNMRTVPVGITLYQGEYAFPWHVISAAITIGMIPLLVLILVFQKRIISGLAAGGVKG